MVIRRNVSIKKNEHLRHPNKGPQERKLKDKVELII